MYDHDSPLEASPAITIGHGCALFLPGRPALLAQGSFRPPSLFATDPVDWNLDADYSKAMRLSHALPAQGGLLTARRNYIRALAASTVKADPVESCGEWSRRSICCSTFIEIFEVFPSWIFLALFASFWLMPCQHRVDQSSERLNLAPRDKRDHTSHSIGLAPSYSPTARHRHRMSGQYNYEYTPQATEEHLMDTAVSGDEYTVGSSNQPNDQWSTTPRSNGVYDHHHQVNGHLEGSFQSMTQHQLPPYTPIRQYTEDQHNASQTHNSLSADFCFLGSTHYTPRLGHENMHGAGYNSNMTDLQYDVVEAGGQLSLEEHTAIQYEGPFHATNAFYNGLEGTGRAEYNPLNDVDASRRMEIGYTTSTSASTGVMHSTSAEDPDNALLLGTLDRDPNRYHQLEPYTDGLVELADVSRYNGHISSMNGSCTSVGMPQPLRVIQAQASQYPSSVEVNPIAGDGPVWTPVPHSRPVMMDSDSSDDQSRIMSDNHLKPPASSWASDAPSPTNTESLADVLYCPLKGCDAKFTGHYRKGNFSRHRRLRHDGPKKRYPCEDPSCTRVFQRTDARLKHHRAEHPHLQKAPPVSRKSMSSIGSDYSHVDSMTDVDRNDVDNGEGSSHGNVLGYQGYYG
ncbi:hypothetical protein OPT61_g2298 [Boeremia exigua]|uniref:Uncharacterized protein n=1 Tax=Boeremia exigua TaxID=749465 RepID=A0ACC2IM04_9PLEO|nr:hypothetical protein OPT61_g2298 [Boeremia exigua]